MLRFTQQSQVHSNWKNAQAWRYAALEMDVTPMAVDEYLALPVDVLAAVADPSNTED